MNIDDINNQINEEASKLTISEEDVPGPAQDDLYEAIYEDLPPTGGRHNPGSFKYKIREFTRHSDERFVNDAYLKILGREADPSGKYETLRVLSSGKTTRYDILKSLLKSDEYRYSGRKVRIRGLHTYKRLLKLKKAFEKIPGIRWLNQYLYNFVHLNHFIRQIQSQSLELKKYQLDLQHQLEAYERNFEKLSEVQEIVEQNRGEVKEAIAELKTKQQCAESKNTRELELALQSIAELRAKSAVSESTSNSAENAAPVPKAAKAVNSSPENNGSAKTYYQIDYFDFENHFRGSQEHIKKVQEVYLPYFKGRKHVLDLGCGRGEFIELLKENNVGVTGVDRYLPYVEYLKLKKLPIVCADVFQYLKEQKNVDGIFVCQVVEHLTIEQILELIHMAYEKLVPGSYLVMETQNPQTLSIFTHGFYIDPSHNHPVHPLTLKYLAEKEGFQTEILYTESSRMPEHIPAIRPNDPEYAEFNAAMARLSEEMYGSQDYAIIAKK